MCVCDTVCLLVDCQTVSVGKAPVKIFIPKKTKKYTEVGDSEGNRSGDFCRGRGMDMYWDYYSTGIARFGLVLLLLLD